MGPVVRRDAVQPGLEDLEDILGHAAFVLGDLQRGGELRARSLPASDPTEQPAAEHGGEFQGPSDISRVAYRGQSLGSDRSSS